MVELLVTIVILACIATAEIHIIHWPIIYFLQRVGLLQAENRCK